MAHISLFWFIKIQWNAWLPAHSTRLFPSVTWIYEFECGSSAEGNKFPSSYLVMRLTKFCSSRFLGVVLFHFHLLILTFVLSFFSFALLCLGSYRVDTISISATDTRHTGNSINWRCDKKFKTCNLHSLVKIIKCKRWFSAYIWFVCHFN